MNPWYISELCRLPGLSCACGCVTEEAMAKYTSEQLARQIIEKKIPNIALTCDKLVFDDAGRIYCTEHPFVNGGIDKRPYLYCIREYLCDSARAFNKQDEAIKRDMVQILKSQRLDPFKFARAMRQERYVEQLLGDK